MSTRTLSPYFSPNSATAPASMASCGAISSVSAGRFWRITALTSASMRVDLGGRQRRAVAEVEAHALAVDQLALLRHVRAQHMLERRVRQVGGGVVEPGAGAPLGIDLEVHAARRAPGGPR